MPEETIVNYLPLPPSLSLSFSFSLDFLFLLPADRGQFSLLSRFHGLLKKLNRRGEHESSQFAPSARLSRWSGAEIGSKVQSRLRSHFDRYFVPRSASSLSLSLFHSVSLILFSLCASPLADWFLRSNFYIARGRSEASFDFNKINYKLPTETSRSSDGRRF